MTDLSVELRLASRLSKPDPVSLKNVIWNHRKFHKINDFSRG